MGETTASYSKDGEDREVLRFFGGRPGVFVEAGANHPVIINQTYLLELSGWTGVLVEPFSELAALCRKERPASRVFEEALVPPGGPSRVRMTMPEGNASLAKVSDAGRSSSGSETFECPARTFDAVLEESGIQSIDYLSLDMEGYECEALKGFTWNRWKPQLVSIEDSCEDFEKHRLLTSQGYRLIRRIGDNNWYVPNTSEAHPTAGERANVVRKLYLGMPFRKVRNGLRKLRGR